jgi:hypothetical protein
MNPLNPTKTKGTPSTRHVRSAPDTVIQQGDAGSQEDVRSRLAAYPPEEAPEEAHEAFLWPAETL